MNLCTYPLSLDFSLSSCFLMTSLSVSVISVYWKICFVATVVKVKQGTNSILMFSHSFLALNPDKWIEFKLQDRAPVSHNSHLFRFFFFLCYFIIIALML